ncbi:interleukin-10 receptor subunit alpha [Clupea harengus]|uniref:Interleukin-10 receptor subunit alpha n=1 Tax=Clupea harengus TaxID=7950 RepID=A0A6P8G2L5_CLUHA|nr:interleukin-10 receptor subunit alpha [Clupea harengus]
MDSRALLHTLSVLFLVLKCMLGQDVKGPVDLEIHIWEEEVKVTWRPQEDAPENAKYLVQVGRSNEPRVNVTSCEATALTQCDISDLVTNQSSRYLVWVGLLTLQGNYVWSKRKGFTMKESKLLPPIFSLAAHSGSVSVKVQQKPGLLRVFKFGVKYTISLTGQDNQTIHEKEMTYDKENPCEDTMFEELPWGQKYCVRVMVNSLTTPTSNISEHCIYLNPDEFTITLLVIAVLGSVVGLAALGILFFLCHPARTPATLKTLGTRWRPLSIDQTPVEVVIGDGWLLSRAPPKAERELSEDKMAILQEEEKRVSLDSGVSMEANSTSGDAGRQDGPQEDSGCGSLGSSAENESDHGGSGMLPLLERRNKCTGVTQREDSGLGLGFNGEPAGDSEGRDSGSFPDVEVSNGDGYRSQSPSSMVVLSSSHEETPTQTLPETGFDMAAPVIGYRPSHVITHKQTVHYSEAPTDTTEQDLPVSNYLRKTQAVEARGLPDLSSLSRQTSQSLCEMTPFLVSLPQLLEDEKGAGCGLTILPLSLGAMELTFG